jgi:hypothetical protein
MLRLMGEQSTGRRAIKASSSFAAFAPHWYCKLSFAPTKLTAFRRINCPQARARPMNFQRVAVNDAGAARSYQSPRRRFGRLLRDEGCMSQIKGRWI